MSNIDYDRGMDIRDGNLDYASREDEFDREAQLTDQEYDKWESRELFLGLTQEGVRFV